MIYEQICNARGVRPCIFETNKSLKRSSSIVWCDTQVGGRWHMALDDRDNMVVGLVRRSACTEAVSGTSLMLLLFS